MYWFECVLLLVPFLFSAHVFIVARSLVMMRFVCLTFIEEVDIKSVVCTQMLWRSTLWYILHIPEYKKKLFHFLHLSFVDAISSLYCLIKTLWNLLLLFWIYSDFFCCSHSLLNKPLEYICDILKKWLDCTLANASKIDVWQPKQVERVESVETELKRNRIYPIYKAFFCHFLFMFECKNVIMVLYVRNDLNLVYNQFNIISGTGRKFKTI